MITYKLSHDRVVYVVLYFFAKSIFSIPLYIQEKMKIKLRRFGKLNYSSCCPVFKFQFFISPVSKSFPMYFAALSIKGVEFISLPLNFEFSPKAVFSKQWDRSNSVLLQSSAHLKWVFAHVISLLPLP